MRSRRSTTVLFVDGGYTAMRLITFRCKTQTIDSVFIRGGDVGTRPNAPISLTIGAVIRDREGAARIRSARCAAPPPRRRQAFGLDPSADRPVARLRCPPRPCDRG